MRILMIAPEPFFEPRGTPISVCQRARGLTSLGHTVDLATYHVGQNVNIPGVTVHRIPRVPFINEVKVGPSWCKPLLDLLLFLKAVSLLTTNRYDVIHSHEEAAFFSVWLARVFGTRHVYDMHSSLPRQLARSGFGKYRPLVKAFETLEKKAIRTCDALITIGSDLEEHAKALRPDVRQVVIENLPLFDLDNGANCTSVAHQMSKQASKNGLSIVYAGNFERYQGVELLLESAKAVLERHPEATFVLLGGKKGQIKAFEDVARRYQVEERFRFLGTVAPEEANRHLRTASILVSPRTDGTSIPLKIYTYLDCGKPIVATDLPAHRLVLNDDNAVLVQPTKEALAEGILRVVDDPELGRRLGLRAKQLAEERYGLETYLAKLAQVYQPLLPATDTLQQAYHYPEN